MGGQANGKTGGWVLVFFHPAEINYLFHAVCMMFRFQCVSHGRRRRLESVCGILDRKQQSVKRLLCGTTKWVMWVGVGRASTHPPPFRGVRIICGREVYVVGQREDANVLDE